MISIAEKLCLFVFMKLYIYVKQEIPTVRENPRSKDVLKKGWVL